MKSPPPAVAVSVSATSHQMNNIFKFSPRSINVNIETPIHPLIPQKEIIDMPLLNKIIETPRINPVQEIGDAINQKEIIDPSINNKVDDNGIQAARLIVIRRKKMKKHKLQKLRKKMKFEWAKVGSYLCYNNVSLLKKIYPF